MNADKQDLKKVLKDLPPHFWMQCSDLTEDDVPTLRCIIQEHEHNWDDRERIEVEMLIKRLNEKWKEEQIRATQTKDYE